MVRKCCLCFFVFIGVLLINTVTSVETYYKLVGKNDDEAMNDENKPFLTQSFFVCGSKENCKKIAKTIESSEFKEVIGQQKLKEDSVAYEKMETPKAKGRLRSLDLITILAEVHMYDYLYVPSIKDLWQKISITPS